MLDTKAHLFAPVSALSLDDLVPLTISTATWTAYSTFRSYAIWGTTATGPAWDAHPSIWSCSSNSSWLRFSTASDPNTSFCGWRRTGCVCAGPQQTAVFAAIGGA